MIFDGIWCYFERMPAEKPKLDSKQKQVSTVKMRKIEERSKKKNGNKARG